MKDLQTLKNLAEDIRNAALRIQPEELKTLLQRVRGNAERAKLETLLMENRTFSYMSAIGSILIGYGHQGYSLDTERRRRDHAHQVAIIHNLYKKVIRASFPAVLVEDSFRYANEEQSEDSILGNTRQALLAQGYRNIDLDLFQAFCRLDFEKVKDMLANGADPEIRIGSHSISELAEKKVNSRKTEFECLLDGNAPCDELGLLELGAYTEMLQLFDKYNSSRYINEARNNPSNRPVRLYFSYDLPEFGWIDMHFYIDGQHMSMINLSDVYDPFLDIWRWIQKVKSSKITETVTINCERYNVELSFTPDQAEEGKGYFRFSDDSGIEDGFTVRTETSELINVMERSILSFRKDMKDWKVDISDFMNLKRIRIKD